MNYLLFVQNICDYAISLIKVDKKLYFRPMNRLNSRVDIKRGYVLGRTNLKTGLITIDIFTPRFRKPKAVPSLLRILAHEIAHHQKPPFRSNYRGHMIIRRHYPKFYRQVNRIIGIFKQDKKLKVHFER